ncbi:MAG: hypothetical protein QW584_00985 [Thermofilaceae archaeon]
MSITKKRDEEDMTLVEQASIATTEFLNELNNLTGWWIINYKDKEKKKEGNVMLYELIENQFNMVEKVSTLDLQTTVYDLRVTEPLLVPNFPLEVAGGIDVVLKTSDNFSVYRLTKGQTTMLGISEDIHVSTVFEYPPRSLVSMLFYLLNPEVERFVRELAREHLTSEEAAEALDTWSYTYDKVMEIKINKRIGPQLEESRYRDVLVSKFIVNYLGKYRSLDTIAFDVVKTGWDLQRLYVVILKRKEEYVTYFMVNQKEVKHLLDAMLPYSDIVALAKNSSTILSAVRKVPMLVKVIESLDEDWFKNFAKLFQK